MRRKLEPVPEAWNRDKETRKLWRKLRTQINNRMKRHVARSQR